jgi:prolyl-tRNA synthetase
VRWEKTTRPFLRSLEFLWQEGHTAHATKEDATEETYKMLNVYAEVAEDYLAIPVIKGKKTEKEKFAGAEFTLTIESMMHDGKALQSGTSHYLGTGFAKAFGIQFTDQNGELQYVHQTSWGFTTRMIGALIMVHGDNRGLKLPPKIAPTQLMIIPIAQHKEGVLDKAYELKAELEKTFRVGIDASDKMPGWKFNEYEMKGIPLRLEVGPKDIEKNQVVLVRRDTGEKQFVSMTDLHAKITETLEDIQKQMYLQAKQRLEDKTYVATNMSEFEEKINAEDGGFIKAMWCGDVACEDAIKEKTSATSRCIPFEEEKVSDTCVCCGKEAKHQVYWAKAY